LADGGGGASTFTLVDPTGGHAQQLLGRRHTYVDASVLAVLAGDTTTGIDAALQPPD